MTLGENFESIISTVVARMQSKAKLGYTFLIAYDYDKKYGPNCSNLGFVVPTNKAFFSTIECSPLIQEKTSSDLLEFTIAHELSHSLCLSIDEYPTLFPCVNDKIEYLSSYFSTNGVEFIRTSTNNYTSILDKIVSVAKWAKLILRLSQLNLEFQADKYAGEILDLDYKSGKELLSELRQLCLCKACEEQIDLRIEALNKW